MHEQTDRSMPAKQHDIRATTTSGAVQTAEPFGARPISRVGMRMLSDSSLAGVDRGSSSSATASHQWDWTASQAQAQVTPDGRISTPGLDSHRALILAVLFCALVGAVISLNSLLQCALHYCDRRRRRRSALPPPAGLKKSVIRRMPVMLYEAGATAGAECAICLGEFADGDAVRLLPRCRHGFHVHCIDTWLSAHSSCPICRDSLLDESATAAAAGEDTTAWMSPSFAAGMLILP